MATNARRDDILLDTERQRALDRMRKGDNDKLDVVIVSLWQTSDLLTGAIQRNDDYHKPNGWRGIVKQHGPGVGYGAGGVGVLAVILQALQNLLGG